MKTHLSFSTYPFPAQAPLVVGVSGGSDSLGLLYLLLERWPGVKKRLVVAHVNYGLRGRSSDKDEDHIRQICRREGLDFHCLKVKKFLQKAKRQKRSTQDLAREIRYGFFQELVSAKKAWGAAVGHHLEDQAETLLDRLLRGSGSRGLSGLRPVQVLKFGPRGSTLKVWRPLLAFSKEQIQDFLKERGIAWREDRTNRENKYRRNQIRNEVLPFLMRWNPNLPKALSRMGEVTAAEDAYLETLLGPIERKLGSQWGKARYSCRADVFEKLPLALKRRWVRAVAEKLVEDARGFSFERIEEIIKLWEGSQNGPRDLGFGLTAGRSKNRVFMRG